MTELAYLPTVDQAYVSRFRARVVALPPGAVVLDRTYFYPTGGGQPCDRGSLAGDDGVRLEVVDVAKSGSAVVHRVHSVGPAPARPTVGAELAGAIDWPRRHRHMRLHTGQHVLSARIFARTGRRTRRASFSGLRGQLDLDGPVPPDVLPALVEDLRLASVPGEPVSIRHIPRAEWDAHPSSERSGLVPLPPQVDPVRVVDIGSVDVCPCGGTHLRTTAEIGAVTLDPGTPVVDGGVRVTFSLAETSPPTPDV